MISLSHNKNDISHDSKTQNLERQNRKKKAAGEEVRMVNGYTGNAAMLVKGP